MRRLAEFILLSNLLLITKSASDAEFEEDFIHSFLIKSEKLAKSERLKSADKNWFTNSAFKNAVAISIENWTNQKLEFPSLSQTEGATDRWYSPQDIPKHTRDISLLAYSSRGSAGNKGTVSYLLEDSWPRLYIVLGWTFVSGKLEILISIADKHLQYEDLLKKELNTLAMKDKMRFYKGSNHYVVAVTCHENLDVWAWEKYYKEESPSVETKSVSLQKIDVEVLPTQSMPSDDKGRTLSEEEDSEPGIFSRKDLLTPGESVLEVVGNRSEREVLARMGGSVAVAIRLENWARHGLTRPSVLLEQGRQTSQLPVTTVSPGNLEVMILEQDQGATGVSAVVRWYVGDTDTVLSLMISVPYSLHLWSAWVAAGLTKDSALPDFSAMYYGTPDSAWFVRQKMGNKMEFSNGDLILVVETDSGTSKPVVRLSVVPLKTEEVAKSIQYRLAGKSVPTPVRRGREGDNSFLALSSSSTASQCHCPCLALSSHNCLARIILALAVVLHLQNFLP